MPPEPDSPGSVWVLVDPFDDRVVGVYDSKAKAQAAGDEYQRHQIVEAEDGMRIEQHWLNREL